MDTKEATELIRRMIEARANEAKATEAAKAAKAEFIAKLIKEGK